MIHPPSLLTIRRRFPRLDIETIECFRNLPASVVADAQEGRGGLDHRILPVTPDPRFVGTALTARCGPGDNLAALAALELAQAQDIIVISCDGYDRVGVIGDRYAGMARNKGIAGIIVDGLVRDGPGIRQAGVPCYARGTSASSAYSNGPGDVGLPIVLGGVRIDAGDLVLSDGEDLVVVSRERLPHVRAALEQVKQNELELDRAIADGQAGFEWVRSLVFSPQTRWIEEPASPE